MESYIEISFITNLLISLCAYYLSAYFSLSKIKIKIFLYLILIEQCIQIFIFDSTFYIFFFIYEISIYLYLFYKNFKKGIMFLCIKYLIIFTLFKFYGGSFHLFHYYVEIEKNIIGIWIVLFILIVLLKQKWSSYLEISDFIYDVYFHTNRPFLIKGFIDTGNNVKCDNTPVLFVDCRYRDHFLSFPSKHILINTVNGEKIRKVYLCEVTIKGYKKQRYYICCDIPIILEFNCRCLLNIDN